MVRLQVPRPRQTRPRTLAAAVAIGGVACIVASTASARMNIVYATEETATTIVQADRPGGLGLEDNVYRQGPTNQAALAQLAPAPGAPAAPSPPDDPNKIAKLSGSQLANMSGKEMVEALRSRIDHGCGDLGCGAHMVAVDELTPAFADGRVKIRRKTVNVRGRKLRIVAYNDVQVTRKGYRIIRREPPLPKIERDSPASRLARAMRALEKVESAYGGTYASRVHFYLSPAFVTSVGLGKGEHRTLGADGLPHRRAWRGVMPALIQAGGVWLEMYNGSNVHRQSRAYPVKHWLKIPKSFARYFNEFGGERSRLHFMIAGSATLPEGAPAGCGGGDPMRCQWQLADLPGTNRAILRNGVGAYSVGDQADEWLSEYVSRVRTEPVVYQD